MNGGLTRGERRSAARLAAVQGLYQMDLTGKGAFEVFGEFETFWIGKEIEGDQYKPAERGLFRAIVNGVVEHQIALDRTADRILSDGWPLKRVEALMRAVIRAGAFELTHARDVPVKVVVSEYVDVAHAFVEGDETGMVNAVLDQIARQFRSGEFGR